MRNRWEVPLVRFSKRSFLTRTSSGSLPGPLTSENRDFRRGESTASEGLDRPLEALGVPMGLARLLACRKPRGMVLCADGLEPLDRDRLGVEADTVPMVHDDELERPAAMGLPGTAS